MSRLRPPLLFPLLLTFLVVLARAPLPGGDLWWHAAVGRFLWENGAIPFLDPFSWSAKGVAWTPHSLLFEFLVGAWNQWAGLDGLRVLRGLFPATAAVSLTILLTRLAPRRRVQVAVLTAAAALPCLLLGRIRPHWVPLVLAPIAWGWVDRTLEGEEPSLPGYFALAWVWCLAHGSGLLAMVIPGAALALDGVWSGRGKRLAGAVGLASLATLATPNGLGVWWYVVRLSQEDFNKGFVDEWQPPPIGSGVQLIPQLAMLAMVLILLWRRPSARRWEWLWAAVWLTGYFRHLRQLGLALFALAPLVARALGPGPVDDTLEDDEPRRAVGALVGLAVVSATGLATGLLRLPAPAVKPSHIPVAALNPWLKARRPQRLFHAFDWGGYLAYQTRGEVGAFVDGRIFLYGREIITDYFLITRGAPGWQEAFRRYDFDVVLLPRHYECLDRILALGGWREGTAPDPSLRLLEPDPGR